MVNTRLKSVCGLQTHFTSNLFNYHKIIDKIKFDVHINEIIITNTITTIIVNQGNITNFNYK